MHKINKYNYMAQTSCLPHSRLLIISPISLHMTIFKHCKNFIIHVQCMLTVVSDRPIYWYAAQKNLCRKH